MKHSILRHKFALGLAAALLLASCSQDGPAEKDTSLPAGKYPLELTASIGESAATPAARGTVHGGWPYSGVLHIASSIESPDEDNLKWGDRYGYDIDMDGAMSIDYGGDDPACWRKPDEILYIYAGKMPLDIAGQGSAWTVEADQGNEDNLDKSDYLSAYGALTFKGDHKLKFRHLTSKITINLKQAGYLKAQDPDAVEVTLNTKDEDGKWYIEGIFKGQPKEIRLEAEEGLEQTDVIIPYTYKAPDPTAGDIYATYEAVLIPQQIAGTGKTIQVKVGDATYSYTIECPKDKFSGGEEWTYNITVDAKGLDVKLYRDENIIYWDTDGRHHYQEVELP